MASINSTATRKGRCKATFAVLPVGRHGEARKVNLQDESNPTYIRLADGTVQRLRSVGQIKAAEQAGLGPVLCTQIRGSQNPTFYPANQVASVPEGSAAHKAGVKPGDEIEAVTLIDPATGEPILGEDGHPVSARSADMRTMRKILADHPDGQFQLTVRRGDTTLNLNMTGRQDDAGRTSWETAEAAHEAWRARMAEQQVDGPIYATTPAGEIDINRPFSELPAAYVTSLKNTADHAYREASAFNAMLQGQGSGYDARALLRAGTDQAGLAERLYDSSSEGETSGVPFPSAPEHVRLRYQALAEAMLKAAPDPGVLHGLNAPFGPAARGEDGDGYIRLAPEILEVDPNGAAAEAGLRKGDRIVGIEGMPGLSVSEMRQVIRSSEGASLRLIVDSAAEGAHGSGPLARLRTVAVTPEMSGLGVKFSTGYQGEDASAASDDAFSVPVTPEFRILSEEGRREASDDIRKGGKGYGIRGYATSPNGTDSWNLRTLKSHKDASGKGAAAATAAAAAPLPRELEEQADRLYARGIPGRSAEKPMPLDQFAPDGVSPVRAALTRTEAPVPIEIPEGDIKARLAAGIMVAQMAGVDVANDPGAMARIEYIERMHDAPVPERFAPGSVYAAFVAAMRPDSYGTEVSKVAEWIMTGSSDQMVRHLRTSGRKLSSVREDGTEVERTEAGTVVMSTQDKYDYGLDRTGHAWGRAVVRSSTSDELATVTVADAPPDALERIVEELNIREQSAAGKRARGSAWSVRPQGPDKVTAILPGDSTSLAPKEIAEIVDRHLPAADQDLPDLPRKDVQIDRAARLRVNDDPEARRHVQVAINMHHDARTAWNEVDRASTSAYAYGPSPTKVVESGLHLRPEAADTVLLQPEYLQFTKKPYPTSGITLAVLSGDSTDRKVITAQGIGQYGSEDYSKWAASHVAVQALPQAPKEQAEQASDDNRRGVPRFAVDYLMREQGMTEAEAAAAAAQRLGRSQDPQQPADTTPAERPNWFSDPEPSGQPVQSGTDRRVEVLTRDEIKYRASLDAERTLGLDGTWAVDNVAAGSRKIRRILDKHRRGTMSNDEAYYKLIDILSTSRKVTDRGGPGVVRAAAAYLLDGDIPIR